MVAVIDERLDDEVMITVIATGFEREEPAAQVRRPMASAMAPLRQEALRDFAARRPDPPEQRVERPAYIRRPNGTREPAERVSSRTMMAAEEEWDVPTFLRRQAD